jgi:hypothetical protein
VLSCHLHSSHPHTSQRHGLPSSFLELKLYKPCRHDAWDQTELCASMMCNDTWGHDLTLTGCPNRTTLTPNRSRPATKLSTATFDAATASTWPPDGASKRSAASQKCSRVVVLPVPAAAAAARLMWCTKRDARRGEARSAYLLSKSAAEWWSCLYQQQQQQQQQQGVRCAGGGYLSGRRLRCKLTHNTSCSWFTYGCCR